MKLFALSILLFWSVDAWSCSCMRIASIDESVAREPVLVEGQVISLEKVTSKEYGTQVFSATLKVVRTLKGVVDSDTVTVEHLMCYASLDPSGMKIGHTYVLPLSQPSSNQRFHMALCAHSGMELISGKLYTFEQAKGVGRRLQFYKNYPAFVGELKK